MLFTPKWIFSLLLNVTMVANKSHGIPNGHYFHNLVQLVHLTIIQLVLLFISLISVVIFYIPCQPIEYGNDVLNMLSYFIVKIFITDAKVVFSCSVISFILFMCLLGNTIVSYGHIAQNGTKTTQCWFSVTILIYLKAYVLKSNFTKKLLLAYLNNYPWYIPLYFLPVLNK